MPPLDINRVNGKKVVHFKFDFPSPCWFWLRINNLTICLHSLVPSQPCGLAVSKVLTEIFLAVLKATDFMSDVKIHSLINMSAPGDWQHSSRKENKTMFYVNKKSGMNSIE